MSDYNYYTLKVKNLDGSMYDGHKGVVAVFKDWNEEIGYIFDYDGESQMDINHFDHTKYFSKFSKEFFNELVFDLEVFGDSGHFKYYYHDGEYYRVEVGWPNFDIDKLTKDKGYNNGTD